MCFPTTLDLDSTGVINIGICQIEGFGTRRTADNSGLKEDPTGEFSGSGPHVTESLWNGTGTPKRGNFYGRVPLFHRPQISSISARAPAQNQSTVLASLHNLRILVFDLLSKTQRIKQNSTSTKPIEKSLVGCFQYSGMANGTLSTKTKTGFRVLSHLKSQWQHVATQTRGMISKKLPHPRRAPLPHPPASPRRAPLPNSRTPAINANAQTCPSARQLPHPLR